MKRRIEEVIFHCLYLGNLRLTNKELQLICKKLLCLISITYVILHRSKMRSKHFNI